MATTAFAIDERVGTTITSASVIPPERRPKSIFGEKKIWGHQNKYIIKKGTFYYFVLKKKLIKSFKSYVSAVSLFTFPFPFEYQASKVIY